MSMSTSIPYQGQIYELNGVEWCELEDLTEGKPETEMETIVYDFLMSKGYFVSSPKKIIKPETTPEPMNIPTVSERNVWTPAKILSERERLLAKREQLFRREQALSKKESLATPPPIVKQQGFLVSFYKDIFDNFTFVDICKAGIAIIVAVIVLQLLF